MATTATPAVATGGNFSHHYGEELAAFAGRGGVLPVLPPALQQAQKQALSAESLLASLCDAYMTVQQDTTTTTDHQRLDSLEEWRSRVQEDALQLFAADAKTVKVWEHHSDCDADELATTWCGYTFVWLLNQLIANKKQDSRVEKRYNKYLKLYKKLRKDLKKSYKQDANDYYLSSASEASDIGEQENSSRHRRRSSKSLRRLSHQHSFATLLEEQEETYIPIVFEHGMDFLEGELYYAMVDAQERQGGAIPSIASSASTGGRAVSVSALLITTSSCLPRRSCLKKTSSRWSSSSSSFGGKNSTSRQQHATPPPPLKNEESAPQGTRRRFSFSGMPRFAPYCHQQQRQQRGQSTSALPVVGITESSNSTTLMTAAGADDSLLHCPRQVSFCEYVRVKTVSKYFKEKAQFWQSRQDLNRCMLRSMTERWQEELWRNDDDDVVPELVVTTPPLPTLMPSFSNTTSAEDSLAVSTKNPLPLLKDTSSSHQQQQPNNNNMFTPPAQLLDSNLLALSLGGSLPPPPPSAHALPYTSPAMLRRSTKPCLLHKQE